jgi:hypothetical protein
MVSIPGYSQSERNYPEPCEPFPFLAGVSQDVLIGENSYCWMITVPTGTATRGYVDCVYISVNRPKAFDTSKNAIHYVNFKKVPFSRDKSVQLPKEENLTAELPAELGQLIGKAWGTVLSHVSYQDPKGEGGLIRVLVDGPTNYFGFVGFRLGLRGHYYGDIHFLVIGEALLIQNIGYELQSLVRSDVNQRMACLKRLREFSNQILALQKNNDH